MARPKILLLVLDPALRRLIGTQLHVSPVVDLGNSSDGVTRNMVHGCLHRRRKAHRLRWIHGEDLLDRLVGVIGKREGL